MEYDFENLRWSPPINNGVILVRGAEVIVIGTDGHAVAGTEVGELCIAGPMLMAGYLTLAGDTAGFLRCAIVDCSIYQA